VGFLIVIAIAVTVGVLVYRLTDGGEPAVGTPEDGPSPELAATATAGGQATAATAPSDVEEWAGGDVGSPGRTHPRPSPGPRRVELSPEAGSIPVVGARPSWHSRLGGALGLLVAVGLGAIAIAGTLYLAGTMIARLISNAG
jgi:hypothetical protein